jgi:hypothetical protein
VFTTARQWSLSWARWIQSTPSHPISLRSILILSFHLCLRLSNGVFPTGFPKILGTSHNFHACYMPRPSQPPWLDHPNNIWLSIQVLRSPSLCSLLQSLATSS